jgi:chaperonin GroEL
VAGKVVVYRDEARDSLLRGVDLITDLVGPTLGPRGRHVVLQRFEAPPLVTNDGVTIARSLELLQDPLTNQGVQLLREVAATAEDFLGDGTTTAMLLARAIVREAFRQAAHGAAPDALCRGIDAAATAAGRWIESQGRPLAEPAELARVATIASRDAEIGRLVAEALERVGAEGVVRIEDDRAYGIRLEFREGMRFDNGLLAPALATDRRRGETAFERAYVLAAGERITQVRQLVPVLSAIAEERAPLLIVADEVSGDALTLLVLNVSKRRLPVVAVKAPAFGADRVEALRDIAVFTGAELLGPGTGRAVESARLDDLGRADRVVATHEETAIVGGHGDAGRIAARVRQAEGELSFLESDYEREKRRIRIARLGGAVALIAVGLDTEAEQEETRHRISDAIHSGRAALAGGIVPGGGATLLRAAAAIGSAPAGEEAAGWAVVRAALEAPLRQLASNAGMDPSVAAARVRGLPPGHGLDMETGRPVDLLAAGIFDPTRIARSTLEIAASVARACLRTDAVIAHRPAPRPRRRGHGHSHSHDHSHHGGHDHTAPLEETAPAR